MLSCTNCLGQIIPPGSYLGNWARSESQVLIFIWNQLAWSSKFI